MGRQILSRAYFRKQFKEPMEQGIKTCTTRSAYLGNVGDLFFVRGSLYEIKALERRTLGDIARYLWKEEGTASEQDFIDIWIDIHGAFANQRRTLMYVTHFRRVPVGTFMIVEKDGIKLYGDAVMAEEAAARQYELALPSPERGA